MGSIDGLIDAGLIAALISAAFGAYRSPKVRIYWMLLAGCLLALALNQFFSTGRPVAAPGILLPGSDLTRWMQLELEPWQRRCIEPCFWIFISTQLDIGRRVGSKVLFASAVYWILCLAVESCLLIPAMTDNFSLVVLHWGLLLAALGALIAAPLLKSAELAQVQPQPVRALLKLSAGFAAVWIPAAAIFAANPQPLQVGAHYYSWFPENWNAGEVWSKLVPPTGPVLGRYTSDDPEIFAQHAHWAEEYGVDFFIFDWWPQRLDFYRRVKKYLEPGKLPAAVKFAFMYETSDLRESKDAAIPGEPADTVYISEQRAWRLKKHWEYLAREYMQHPQHLRIGSRHVLFVYNTRHMVGPVLKAVREAREHVRITTGIELFLIADEAYYTVLDFKEPEGTYVLPEYEPNWERIAAFDALTAYNPYASTRKQFAGSSGTKNWFSEVSKLYSRYRRIAGAAGIPFIPTALPGYNDRGVRLKEDHFVLPRFVGASGERSFFADNLQFLALPFTGKSLPMFTVTTWNEWNEGTQIEPAQETPETRLDSSPGGSTYTIGELYRGYGMQHLEELRAFRAAVN